MSEEISAADLQAAQEADPIIQQVRGWVLTGAIPTIKEVRRQNPELAEYRALFRERHSK